jgi:hypothetical protein
MPPAVPPTASTRTALPHSRAAVPLPLPTPGWGAADALAALEAARPRLAPLPSTVTVVSALTTVVLRAGDRAVKVYPLGTDPAHLDRLRRTLTGVASVVGWDAEPVETTHGVVTVMPWVTPVGPMGWPAVGTLLGAFHDETAVLDVPTWTPLSRLAGTVADLPAERAAVLLGARAELLAALHSVGSVLGEGVLHGDVSLENAVLTSRGPRFIDPDWVARGPREYDLASAARRLARGEIGRSAYAAFCDAYGHDVRSWPGLPLLDRFAELGAVAVRLWDCRHHGRDLDWLDGELRRWRAAV